MSTRVKRIIGVTYEIKTNPTRLIVRARGEVTSTGWTNTVLHRRVYSSAPADGVWEYDLQAVCKKLVQQVHLKERTMIS